jgi:cytokinin riboside 5'-monophosphate phosphoribohydrolase
MILKLCCVYCSSSANLSAKYVEAARRLGAMIASNGWGLIYGGGNAGLMGTVAHAVKVGGGHVVGVIPAFMSDRELANGDADELVVVDTMRERKRIMAERADAFVTLPGGIGTLEELSEIMVERYLNLTTKPVVLVNQDGYYDDLLRFFDRMVAERFKPPGLVQVMSVAESVDAVWPLIESPALYEPEPLWRR